MRRASKKEQAGKIIGRFLTIGLSGVRTIGRLWPSGLALATISLPTFSRRLLSCRRSDCRIRRSGEEHASAGDEERQGDSIAQKVSARERAHEQRDDGEDAAHRPWVTASGYRRVRCQAGQCEGQNRGGDICNTELPHGSIPKSHR
jgi:hypothetical protein